MTLIEKIKLFPYAMKGYLMSDPNKNGEFKFLKTIIKDDLIVFDVGANIGEHSNKIFEYSENKKVDIHCFEPVEHTYNTLKNNINESPHHRAFMNNFGLSDKKESREINIYNDLSGNNSIYHIEGVRPYTVKQTQSIELSTVDEYINKNNISRVDLMKIDVEGHEFSVIKGAEKSLNTGVIKNILCEFNDLCKLAGYTIYDLCDYLILRNYTMYRLTPWGKIKIKDPKTIGVPYPIQSNYVAILNS